MRVSLLILVLAVSNLFAAEPASDTLKVEIEGRSIEVAFYGEIASTTRYVEHRVTRLCWDKFGKEWMTAPVAFATAAKTLSGTTFGELYGTPAILNAVSEVLYAKLPGSQEHGMYLHTSAGNVFKSWHFGINPETDRADLYVHFAEGAYDAYCARFVN